MMTKLIPYYATEHSRFVLNIDETPRDIQRYVHGMCHEFAITVSTNFNYDIGIIVDDTNDSWYLIHVYAFYVDTDGVKHYVDVRGQSTDFNFLAEEFGFPIDDDSDTYEFDEEIKFIETNLGDAIEYFRSHSLIFNALDSNVQYLVDTYRAYYEPTQSRLQSLDSKIRNVEQLLRNDSLYNLILEDNTYIRQLGFCEEGCEECAEIARFLQGLLGMEYIGCGTSRAVYGYGNTVFKVSISDTNTSPSRLEVGIQQFLIMKGETFAPSLHYATDNLVVSERVPELTEGDDYWEDLNQIEGICESYGIQLVDVDSPKQLGRREDGQLVILDFSKCQVSDEVYNFLITHQYIFS